MRKKISYVFLLISCLTLVLARFLGVGTGDFGDIAIEAAGYIENLENGGAVLVEAGQSYVQDENYILFCDEFFGNFD